MGRASSWESLFVQIFEDDALGMCYGITLVLELLNGLRHFRLLEGLVLDVVSV